MPVADCSDGSRSEPEVQLGRVQGDVIISQAMSFEKLIFHEYPTAICLNTDSAVGTLQLPISAQDVPKRKRVGVLTGAYSGLCACWLAVRFLASPSPHPSPPSWGRGSMAWMRTGIFPVTICPKFYCCIRVTRLPISRNNRPSQPATPDWLDLEKSWSKNRSHCFLKREAGGFQIALPSR